MFFVQQKPSRWYRREIAIKIPLWPKWLAQLLCNHDDRISGWKKRETIFVCRDCYKCIITTSPCEHNPNDWLIDMTEPVPTATGGGTVISPTLWHCNECGQSFTKNMNCPNCKIQMDITEYMGMFSARFHCPQCGEYYFRGDLE